ncbi:hypothetical protein V5799_017404 [Amblyomma americanum]|uniref:Uncharacterized protein n=1 Tax=Amblyomma americanum TaxID=6943 RepID=A0AAQ4F3D6_AMBAM
MCMTTSCSLLACMEILNPRSGFMKSRLQGFQESKSSLGQNSPCQPAAPVDVNSDYSYPRIKAWTRLAVLHQKENSGRLQAATKHGTAWWQLVHTLSNGYYAGYVHKLLNLVVSEVAKPMLSDSESSAPSTPPPLSSSSPHVEKTELIMRKKTRFNIPQSTAQTILPKNIEVQLSADAQDLL